MVSDARLCLVGTVTIVCVLCVGVQSRGMGRNAFGLDNLLVIYYSYITRVTLTLNFPGQMNNLRESMALGAY